MADWKSEYLRMIRSLVQARVKLNKNQDQFAAILGISRRNLQRYETGELDIPLGIACRWADLAGTSMSAISGAFPSPEKARTK